MKKYIYIAVILTFISYSQNLAGTKFKKSKNRVGYILSPDNIKEEGLINKPAKNLIVDYVRFTPKNGDVKKLYTSDINEFGFEDKGEKIVYRVKTIPTDISSLKNKIQFVKLISEGDIDLYEFKKITAVSGRIILKTMLFFETDDKRISMTNKKVFLETLETKLGVSDLKFGLNYKKIIQAIEQHNSKN